MNEIGIFANARRNGTGSGRLMWGATILAGLLFFVLNVGAGLILERDTLLMALTSGTIKAVIFATLFHYSHNWLAARLGWYEKDD